MKKGEREGGKKNFLQLYISTLLKISLSIQFYFLTILSSFFFGTWRFWIILFCSVLSTVLKYRNYPYKLITFIVSRGNDVTFYCLSLPFHCHVTYPRPPYSPDSSQDVLYNGVNRAWAGSLYSHSNQCLSSGK